MQKFSETSKCITFLNPPNNRVCTGTPGMHGNKEYAYSPVLPGHVVKGD